MMPIPLAYVSLVLDHTLSPRTLWEHLGGVIINDGCDNEYEELMNWMRYTSQLKPTQQQQLLP